MCVEQDLDLDVARAAQEAFEHQAIVAEGARCLSPGGGQAVGQFGRIVDDPHALSAAARGRLDEQRIADVGGGRLERPLILGVAVVTGDGRDAVSCGQSTRRGLVSHRRDRGCRRTDPREPGLGHAPRDVGILGNEAVARVDRIRIRSARRVQDGFRVEVRGDRLHVVDVARNQVVRCPDPDRQDPEVAGRSSDAARDLAAVRDEQP